MAQVAVAAAATVAVSLLSRVLSPTPKPSIADLSISSGAYGDSIPIAYGDIRTQCNLIWSNGWKHVNGGNKKLGGKGKNATKGAAVQTANLAYSICEGPITGVLRIWANGIMIYDASNTYKDPDTGKIVGTGQYAFRFHYGDEAQTPDPLIQLYTDENTGANSTPAYRDLAYFSVQGMNLTKWGNSIPTFHAEVTRNGTPNLPFVPATPLATPIFDDRNYSNVVFDWQSETMYVFDGNGISTYDVSYPDVQIAQATYKQIGIPDAQASGANGVNPATACVCTGKYIVMSCYNTDGTSTIFIIDINSLVLVKTLSFAYALSPIRAMYGFVVPAVTGPFSNTVWGQSNMSTYFILDIDTGQLLFAGGSTTFVSSDDASTFYDGAPGFFMVLPPDQSGLTNSIAKAVLVPNITNTTNFNVYLVTLNILGNAVITQYFSAPLTSLGFPSGYQVNVQSAAIDLTDGGIIIQATGNGNTQAVFKLGTPINSVQLSTGGGGVANSLSGDVGALEAAGVGQDNGSPPGGS